MQYGKMNFSGSTELKTLLGIWAEANIQEKLDGAIRNKSNFESIAKYLHFAKFYGIVAKQLQVSSSTKNECSA